MGIFARLLVLNLISSLGFKRKLTNLFQLLAVIGSTVPGLDLASGIVQGAASWLGVTAIAHSAYAKTFEVDVHSVAAFFSALLLAIKDVPELAPYAPIIRAVAAILSALATVTYISERAGDSTNEL